MAHTHRVVILGGGFGGLYAARELRSAPVDVTLIDRRNFHLFQPLLYQVATGSLSPGEIAFPLRSVLNRQKNTRVLLGEAEDIDAAAQTLRLKDGAVFEYDSLIVAAGSQSFYFGNDAWRAYAPSLKSVEEATEIRRRILYAFEAAERSASPEEHRRWLTFVIVGAGATGVELAGALGEIARQTMKRDFRSIRPQEAQIIVLDGSPRVLPAFPADLSTKAESALIRLGARVRSGVQVTAIDEDGVNFRTASGSLERLESKTVLWAGGVTTSDFGRRMAKSLGCGTDRGGRIKVNPDLTVPGHPEIFVVGDMALVSKPDGTPLPGVAQVAMQEGAYAAKAIVRRVRGESPPAPFHYFDKGDMAVIGRASAVANIFGRHISGLPAWLAWVFIHLMYLVQFQSRVVVFVHWAFLYLTFSRGARLITGEAKTEPVVPVPPR